MIVTLSILGLLILLAGLYFLLKDFSRFVWRKTVAISFPKEFIDFGEYVLTIFTIIFLTALGVLFYKFATAFIAYIFSGDLISFFIVLRGVFTVRNDFQSPFLLQHLIAGLLLAPALQFIACYFIYRSIRSFMLSINKHFRDIIYSESDLLYFGFLSSIAFIFFEIIFYSQSIPSVSGIAHITYLIVSKLSFVSYFLAIAHIHLLRSERYKKSLLTYVHLSKYEKSVIYSPLKIVLLTYFIGVVLFLPFITGSQFLDNNWVLILIFLVACAVFYILLRAFLSNGFNYLGVIMLLESPMELFENKNLLKSMNLKRIVLSAVVALLIFGIFKPKLFFFAFLCLGATALLYLILLSFFYITGLFASLIRATINKIHLPLIRLSEVMRYLVATIKATSKAAFIMMLLMTIVFVLLSFYPRYFENKNNDYVQSIFDDTNRPLYIQYSENNGSVPIPKSAVPAFFSKCLYLQEDRSFQDQNSWLPKMSNWHGVSLSMLYRFYKGGGGSNLNMQLIKNVAFPKSFPQDVQRKFSESLSAYQLSLQWSPGKIETNYLNEVSFNGGKGNSGIMAASLYTFGLPICELNSLEMMYLVTTLKRGSGFKTDSRTIGYDKVALHSKEIKQSLLNEANLWYRQNLITKKELNDIKNSELRFTDMPFHAYCETTTREFLKRQLRETDLHGMTYSASLTSANQKNIAEAVIEFESKFNSFRSIGDLQLYSAALVIDVTTGQILGHYGGNKGVTDLTQFAGGNPLGSVIKPFILIELLEQGYKYEDIQLFDGPIRGRYTPNNYSRTYSMKYLGIDEVLKKSLNAPMVNIWQITDPLPLYKRVEEAFSLMNISKDIFLDLGDQNRKRENEINYPIGSRNMTLFEIAQIYQTLFNKGQFIKLSTFNSVFDPYSDTIKKNIERSQQIFSSNNTEQIVSALKGVMEPGGTGFHVRSLLPSDINFFAKTGTTDGAKHGYTVLCDGKILIVTYVSYGKVVDNHLSLGLAPVPFESGGKSAGVLAALIYNVLDKNRY